MKTNRLIAIGMLALTLPTPQLYAAPPDPDKLEMSEWATNGMTKDPVALSFDRQGRLYLVESARRTTVDIDIRSHREWLLDDLANVDFESMRAFFRRHMAPELSDENASWLEDRNGDGVHDYHDLTAISERIRLLEDTDDDGKADKSTLYAENFNEEFTGVAAGVMPYKGDVLMTVYPDLWRLRDTDRDGKADQREIMFRGFGVHAAFDGHDLHGLTIGPEGKIYFSCGDNGFSIVTKEGRRLHHPNTGGILRMNPDGSDLEVYAIGLRNVQEFDFDQYGNMFAVDNDGDLEDERERAVYIAEGSDHGWRLNWQFRSPGWANYNGGMTYNPWTAEGMWKPQHADQPAYITPPMQNYSVGPGGFKFNPGTALNDEYRDFFFCVQFPVKQVTAFRTRQKGAGFEMVDEHVFNSGLMVSSVNFGPDGGLYMADWVGKWEPNGEGVVYRVDDPQVDGSTVRKEVRRLINEGVKNHTPEQLCELLGHADRRVRQLAQSELAGRKSMRLLETAVDRKAPQLARIHALWGLIQIDSASDPKQRKRHRRVLAVVLPWKDLDPQIRQQCARVAGDLGLQRCERQLVELLEDDSPLVQSHAAIALREFRSADAMTAMLLLLDRNADRDPLIRHAAVMGLAGEGGAAGTNFFSQQLSAQSKSTSAAIRMGAVLALRKQQSRYAQAFLHDGDLRVQREAVRAIHDDFSIPEALPRLAKLLESESMPADEPIVRRVLSANLRVGDSSSAERLAAFVLEPPDLGPLTIPMQIEALRCLASWRQSPLVDRVEGRIRQSDRKAPNAGEDVLNKHLVAMLLSSPPDVIAEVTRIAKEVNLPINIELMKQWAASDRHPEPTRIEALRILHQRDADETDSIIASILATDWHQNTTLHKAAFAVLVERDAELAFDQIDLTAPLPIRRFFISQLPSIRTAPADRLLARLLEDLSAGSAPTDIALDILAAARAKNGTGMASALKIAADRISNHRWGEFQFASQPGDAKLGELLYRNHVNAQCIRCHNAGGKGKQAGPELAGIASRVDRQYLLESLVDPSAKIAKGFESITFVMNDGTLVSGTIITEDEEKLSLGTPKGETVNIDKSEIDERVNQAQSAMPSMRDVLTPIEARDLVEYLWTLR